MKKVRNSAYKQYTPQKKLPTELDLVHQKAIQRVCGRMLKELEVAKLVLKVQETV
jgi:hypothetical protein